MSRWCVARFWGTEVEVHETCLAVWLEQFVREADRRGAQSQAASLAEAWWPLTVDDSDALWTIEIPASVLAFGFTTTEFASICEDVASGWEAVSASPSVETLLRSGVLRVDASMVAALARQIAEKARIVAPE